MRLVVKMTLLILTICQSLNIFSQNRKALKISEITSKLDSAKSISVKDTVTTFRLIKNAKNIALNYHIDSLALLSDYLKLEVLGLLDLNPNIIIAKTDLILKENNNRFSYITLLCNLKKINELSKLNDCTSVYKIIKNEINFKQISIYKKEILFLKLNQAICLVNNSELIQAIDLFNTIAKEAIVMGNDQFAFIAYNNLAGIYSQQNLIEKAIEYDYLALKHCSKKDIRYAQVARNLANKLINEKKYNESINLLKELIGSRTIKPRILASIYSILGENYTHLNILDSAFVNLNKALTIIQENSLNESKGYTYAEFGLYYFKKEEFEKSFSYYIQAIHSLKEFNKDDERILIDVYKYLFETMSKIDNNYKYVNEFVEINDTINTRKISELITKHNLINETEKKNKQILELNVLNDQKKISELKLLNSNISLLNEKKQIEASQKIISSENKILSLNASRSNLENLNIKRQNKLSRELLESKNRHYIQLIWILIFISIILFILGYLFFQNVKKNKLLIENRDQIKLLNQELNHRVKNNLAFMTSLLEMQGRRTDDAEARQLLLESESRLKTLSLIHSNLFNSGNDTDVNLKLYIEELIQHLNYLFDFDHKDVVIHTNFVDHQINAEDAMRIGLIINELVTNSMKHAFDKVVEPTIYITTSIDPAGKVILSYSDNGPGKSSRAIDYSSTSLGIKLIGLLKEQLKGRCEVV